MNKIDVVIAWVDGSDPDHIKNRSKYQASIENLHSEATIETRFGHQGEIYYCIASLLKYATFINRIWIITDNQHPIYLDAFSNAGLCDPDYIRVVDHKIVFRCLEDYLPVFNSLSIEAVLWRIPGLAENFVYMNDDFFINNDISANTFFQNEKPRIHGRMSRPNHRRRKIIIRTFLRKITFRPQNSRPSYRIAQELASNLAGVSEDFLNVDHHPHPMRKSVLEDFFSSRFDVLQKQVSYRFRSVEQFLPASLAYHLEMTAHDGKVLPELGISYYKPKKMLIKYAPFKGLFDGKNPFGCLQSLDECSSEMRRYVHGLMIKKFGEFLPKEIRFDGEN